MKRAMLASMSLAQVVGLFKGEATIQLTQYLDDPFWLRLWVYVVLGAVLTVIISYINVRIIKRLT